MKVKGHPDLVRDSSSGAVVSNDRDGYEKYMETYIQRESGRLEIDDRRRQTTDVA